MRENRKHPTRLLNKLAFNIKRDLDEDQNNNHNGRTYSFALL